LDTARYRIQTSGKKYWGTGGGSQKCSLFTGKKANKIFLIYKEIQSGAVAKSYMRKDFLIYEQMRKHFPLYEENFILFFISVA
jgi:hypothetical protein